MKTRVYLLPLLCVLLFALASPSFPTTATAAEDAEDKSEKKDDSADAKKKEEPPELKPYDKVITKDAKTDEGVFRIHRVKSKIYYEIPAAELNQEFLWVSQVAKTTLGRDFGGAPAGNHVVRWERHENRILLRSVSYAIVSDQSLPVARAVENANYRPIIMAFNVEALGKKDDSVVIDVSKLFTTEVPEFTVRGKLKAKGFDASRSFIERAVSFPTNIEVEATHTFTAPPDDGVPKTTKAGEIPMRPGAASVLMHYSMVKLPAKPMMPRLRDERVGFFSVTQTDFGQDEHRAPKRTYITRYRLEKKDPTASLSEPVKPIAYWIDPATPAKWVPYIKQGIQDWQPAFEAAGFKNAILAVNAPSPANDPDWSPEDARYSVIRWLPSTVMNARGPHVHDPRTGEILEADIELHHNVMNLARNWYFVQAGPLDPRASKLPLPDELMGRLIRYVVAHEVGHTLGFPHNMKSSSLYPVEKIRDPKWVKTMGHVATLMDYSRMNYVAQPEDKIDPDDLIPGIGPYDKWATHWGYAPIPGAKTPDAEKETLDRWARDQDTTPWLRFSTSGGTEADAGEQTEAVGDADSVLATTLGLKNLERVAAMLIPATTTQTGKPYEDLEELYGQLLGQWSREMGHVIRVVGGFDTRQKHIGQEGVRFEPLSKERQVAAQKFLSDHALSTPQFLIRPEILKRIEAVGMIDRLRTAQERILTSLLDSTRLKRMTEQETFNGDQSYRPVEFLTDIRRGLWRELTQSPIKIDAYRRNLQRAHLDLLSDRLDTEKATDDTRALFRGELKELSAQLGKAVPKTGDAITRLHLEDIRAEIARALDPNRPARATPATPATQKALDHEHATGVWSLNCWDELKN